MFVIDDDCAVDSMIIFNEFNKERTCRDNSELRVSIILFNIATINATSIKIMFVESNDKDAYCAHMNFMNVRNSRNIRNSRDSRDSKDFSAFMNMSQLKSTQI
jgi:hypothetical protein